MKSTNTICQLCGQSAMAERTDHGNRMYIACANPTCGDYEISLRAAATLANAAQHKVSLREMAMRANQTGRILHISIASDRRLQAVIINHTSSDNEHE